MLDNALTQYLEWDSEFFGVRIARILPSQIVKHDLHHAVKWCTENSIDCCYFLGTIQEAETTRLIEEHDFHLVDVRMTFGRAIQKDDAIDVFHPSIRSAVEDDIPTLCAIAADSHTDSRFYFDPHFDRAKISELYAVWIEKSCKGYADNVLVITSNDQPMGYISCHLDGNNTGRIGLVALSAIARGQGLGTKLLRHALAWFCANGQTKVIVVTQGRNVPAQRYYQHYGFLTQDIQLWYHRWFSHIGSNE